MRTIIGFLIGFFVFTYSAQSQQDSCGLQISLLTCSPGEELYSTFGHTAIRVKDQSAGTDYVFNYGTFEFSPDFYGKFVRGQLRYYLSADEFINFIYQYQLESRSIVEQPLQISCAEKSQLYAALQQNAQEENRYYLYDFLFDNCTTRARDIIAKNTKTPVTFQNILPQEVPSFRNLIHTYLDLGGQYWSKLGIDILLGAKLDRKVSNLESMFLPDYLKKGLDVAKVGNQALVLPTQSVLIMPSPLNRGSWARPAVIFSLLLALAIALQVAGKRWSFSALRVLDFLFFFILGLSGVLLLYMWFGTDHKVTVNNYNLLWALPTHVVGAFALYKNRSWGNKYFTVVFWLTLLLLVTWFVLPQEMNNALIPLVLLVLYRSWYHSKVKIYGTKTNNPQREAIRV